MATFYLRRQIAETPRYALAMQGDLAAATRTVDMVTGNKQGRTKATPTTNDASVQRTQRSKKSWLHLLLMPRYLRWVIGTAGAWLLLDIVTVGELQN